MTNDKINLPTQAEVRASFRSPPDFGSTIRMMPVADHEVEVARLTAERDYDRKQSEHKSSVIDKLNAAIASAAEKAEAERDAALAGAVKVRPLVWKDAARSYPMFHARSLGLVYEVSCDPDMGWAWAQGDGLVDFAEAETEEIAKAAAQADYEARISAALQPDPDARQADLAGAWMMGREDAAGAAKHAGLAFGYERAVQAIRALTPPADLAAKIGGE